MPTIPVQSKVLKAFVRVHYETLNWYWMVTVKDIKGVGCNNRLLNILSAVQCRAKAHVGHSRSLSDPNSVNMQKAECSLFISWIRDPATLLNLLFCQIASWHIYSYFKCLCVAQ